MKTCLYLYILIIQYTYGQNSVQNSEFIELDSVLINGTLHFKSDTATLYRVLGTPDSIEVPDYDQICASYFDNDFIYLYYKGAEFELYKEKVICRSLNFQDNPALKLKTFVLILDGNTTVEDLKNYFPVAVSKIREIKTAEHGRVFAFGLHTSKKPADDKWTLFFRDGKLIRVDYWIPC